MRQMVKIALHAIAASACISAYAANPKNELDYPSVWECDQVKWHWYCDERPSEPRRSNKQQEKPQPTPHQKLELKDIKTAAGLRDELKRREDIAIMAPTAENLRNYLEVHMMVQNKSSDFADAWRRVVWTNPDLDYSLKHPTNNTGIRVNNETREKAVDRHMQVLAKEHGLMFFFRSDCPYCHAMVPVLEMIERKYGVEILAVSTDGAPLPGLSKWVNNQGQLETLLATHGMRELRVPALFIASKKTGDTAPVGMGVMAYTEIIERIFVLTGTTIGDDF